MRAIGVVIMSAVVAVSSAGAVGASVQAIEPTRKAKACALLESTEIADVFASEVGRAKKGSIPSTCIWSVGGGSGDGGGEVATLVERGKTARVSFDSARTVAGGDVADVEGIGRGAFFAPGLATVFVLLTKRTLFSVQAVFPTESATLDVGDLQAKLVALAKIAADRA